VNAKCKQDLLHNQDNVSKGILGKDALVEKHRLKEVAVQILGISRGHVGAIDALLEEITLFRNASSLDRIKIARCGNLVECIDKRLLLKRFLVITLECVDCELEQMSVLQYELLVELLRDEKNVGSQINSIRNSVDAIKKSQR
jgi:hypothetical protein